MFILYALSWKLFIIFVKNSFAETSTNYVYVQEGFIMERI